MMSDRSMDDGSQESPAIVDLRERLLSALDGEDRFETFVSRAGVFLDLDPAATRAVLTIAAAGPSEADRVFPGVFVRSVATGPERGEAKGSVLWLEPGATIPEHRHQGDEWGLILEGTLEDDLEPPQSVGDYVRKPAGSVHCVRNPGRQRTVVLLLVEIGYEWLGAS